MGLSLCQNIRGRFRYKKTPVSGGFFKDQGNLVNFWLDFKLVEWRR